jgi:hypothetical protein
MRNVTVLNLVSENTIEQRMLETLAAKRSLADGVLDKVGDVTRIPLRRGPQAFMDRLQQVIVTPTPRPRRDGPKADVLPVDRSAGFAARASELIGSRLVACEERYPEEGAHSVILVVVDGEVQHCKERLAAVHDELFGKGTMDPLSPVRLQVIDRETFDALQQLSEAGLIQSTIRTTRQLYPLPENHAEALTEAEKRKAAGLRQKAGRKLKMARVLSTGELDEEAREALMDAVPLLGQALAVENRLPEPQEARDALSAPLAPLWGAALESLCKFVEQPEAPIIPTLEALESSGLNWQLRRSNGSG